MIDPPAQAVRVEISEAGIDELAESIKSVGLLNPITVKPANGRYEIVAGHRRWMAMNKAELLEAPCMIMEETDVSPSAAKLHENLFREDISPAEEAAFYAELLDECGGDCDKVAALVHRSRNLVEGRLLLLTGSQEVLAALAGKKISLGVAEELNHLKRPEDVPYYLNWCVAQGATRGMVHGWVIGANMQAELNAGAHPPVVETPETPPAEFKEPVCYICGYSEPRHDVEFWYIHRSCRVIAERNRQEWLEAQTHGERTGRAEDGDRGGTGEDPA